MDSRYREFYKYEPELESFPQIIENKKGQVIDRKLLNSTIRTQYTNRNLTTSQENNIVSLSENDTFTITTAHQPSLFTGPLYYIYKICSVIKATQLLNNKYKAFHFVPIFISGGEDHDFEEIDHCYLFDKEIKWQEIPGGPVGRKPLDKLDDALETFSEILGKSENAEEIKTLLYNALNKSNNYKEFNFHLVNNLFEDYGLIVIDMDNASLKRAFIPIMEKEILERPSEAIISNTQKLLAEKGFKNQAFPRDINLFYIHDGRRDRITYNGSQYEIVDTSITFSEQSIIIELHNHPERFSPNVAIRPLYQESILPNLAYIGGGGEIAYWLERLDHFDYFGIPFPMLMRRNSALLINKSSNKLMEKLNISINEMLLPIDHIINQFIHRNTSIELDLGKEEEKISNIFDEISESASSIDPTISKWIQAEKTKQIKVISQIESRLKRTIKQQEETKVNQIRKLKEKLFPGNGLQERRENFFQYYMSHGKDMIPLLIDSFDPFDKNLDVITLT